MLKNKKYHFEKCRRRMMENNFLEQYYNLYDEDGKHGCPFVSCDECGAC
jgi:hypothetical protein